MDRTLTRYLNLTAYDSRCVGPVPGARERWAYAQSSVRRDDWERGVVRLRRRHDPLDIRMQVLSRLEGSPSQRLRVLLGMGL